MNAIDYLIWRGDLPFSASPFNEIDLFLCSQIAAADFTGIIPEEGEIALGEAFAAYFSIHSRKECLGILQSEYVLEMYDVIRNTTRFRDVALMHQVSLYDKANVEQFSAVTIRLPDGTFCVSYRGTDDTIIGWKEDCNLGLFEGVPAQKDALEYLNAQAKAFPLHHIRVCGHSKGGNLAVYAAVCAPSDVRGRIIQAVSFDGPGFLESFFRRIAYVEMRHRITTVISQNTMVGVLLNQAGEVVVVESRVPGPLAHDGFNWSVVGTRFVRMESLSNSSKAFRWRASHIIESLSPDERVKFVDELFDAMLAGGRNTLSEIHEMKFPDRLKYIHSLKGGPMVKEFLHQTVKAIGEDAFGNISRKEPHDQMPSV